MKLRFRNWNIILHLRLVLESGLIPLLHILFVQTLFKTFRTENMCYLIIAVTEGGAIRIPSECLESEINRNTKRKGFDKSEYKSGQLGIILRFFQQFFIGGPVIKQSIAQN